MMKNRYSFSQTESCMTHGRGRPFLTFRTVVFVLILLLTSIGTVSAVAGTTWTQATAHAGWSGRTAHSAVLYNNKIWVLGGFNNSGVCNDTWNSPDGGTTWILVNASPGWQARFEQSALVFNNQMWVLGGDSGNGMNAAFSNDVWKSSDGNMWTQVSVGPWPARYGFGAVVFNGKMWILGGDVGGSMANDVWSSSSDGGSWTEVITSAPWTPRENLNAVVYDNRIWVFGGDTGQFGNYLNDTWYSYDGISWTEANASQDGRPVLPPAPRYSTTRCGSWEGRLTNPRPSAIIMMNGTRRTVSSGRRVRRLPHGLQGMARLSL